jgi:hypothetical protein
MLKPADAAPMVRHLLEAGQQGEVVVAGSLGVLENTPPSEIIDLDKADAALRSGTPIHRMLSHLTSYSREEGIHLEVEMDPQELSYLRDHAINGIPVLPGVVGIEGFAVASKHIASVLASGKAGFEVDHLENIQFHVPLKFYGNKPRTMTWHAIAMRSTGDLQVKVSLESDVKRHNGNIDHTLHFEGLVFLSKAPSAAEVVTEPPAWKNTASVEADKIYRLFFHGPSFLVLDAEQLTDGGILGKFNKRLIQTTNGEPEFPATPLLIELCFQTAGLWEAGATGILALPQSVGSLRLYPRPVNGSTIYAEVKPHEEGEKVSFDARVIDSIGNVFLEMNDYLTSPLPYPAEKEVIEPLRALVLGE